MPKRINIEEKIGVLSLKERKALDILKKRTPSRKEKVRLGKMILKKHEMEHKGLGKVI